LVRGPGHPVRLAGVGNGAARAAGSLTVQVSENPKEVRHVRAHPWACHAPLLDIEA
jgi:hypothetical protein